MSAPDDEPTAQEALPDELVETIDELDAPALRQLSTYVNQRLRDSTEPIAELIRGEAQGEILGIEDRGAYTLVRKRSPSQDGGESGPQPISVYHVTREILAGGEETLHWSFIGDVNDSG